MSLCPVPPSLCAVRHLHHTHRTTIRLEKQFWAEIDILSKVAGKDWREWVITELRTKPEASGSASWLRVRCLLLTKKGAKHG